MIGVVETATAVVEFLLRLEGEGAPRLVVTNLVRHERGWVAYFNSKTYVQTSDWTELLGGNGPIVVGDDHSTLQVRSLEDAIEVVGAAV